MVVGNQQEIQELLSRRNQLLEHGKSHISNDFDKINDFINYLKQQVYFCENNSVRGDATVRIDKTTYVITMGSEGCLIQNGTDVLFDITNYTSMSLTDCFCKSGQMPLPSYPTEKSVLQSSEQVKKFLSDVPDIMQAIEYEIETYLKIQIQELERD